MTTLMSGHIVLDGKKVARIAGSRTRVIDVALDKTAYGLNVEQIHAQHPHLSLAQIHAALAYYYDHQAELDADIERGYKAAEKLRSAADPPPVVQRLRESGKRP